MWMLGLAIVLASGASAQLAPGTGAGTGSGASVVRDGDAWWTVERDPGDPAEVVASSRGRSFRARVGPHALVRVRGGDAASALLALGAIPVREIAPSIGA